jgi:hypothetical protein
MYRNPAGLTINLILIKNRFFFNRFFHLAAHQTVYNLAIPHQLVGDGCFPYPIP